MKDKVPFFDLACARHCYSYDREFDSRLAAARQRLELEPEIATCDLAHALVTGTVDWVTQALAEDRERVSQPAPPRDWSPLLYVCFSRFWRDVDHPQRQNDLLQTARLLLENGADPNAYFMAGDERETALYGACGVVNDVRLAALLIEFGANVNDDEVAYHSVEFDDPACMALVAKSGMNRDNLATMLMRKLDFEDLPGVSILIESGADLNHPGRWGKTPLHQAIMRGRSLDCIRLLIRHGADVDARRSDGQTAWSLAWLYCRADIASELATAGCRTESEPELNLIAACVEGKQDRCRAILQSHPNLIDSAASFYDIAIVNAGRSGNLVALHHLHEAGFDLQAHDEQGFTALHWAAWYGHLDCLQWLLDRGADTEARNAYGGTVVDGAVWGWANSDGNKKMGEPVLKRLAAAGADFNAISPRPVRDPQIEAMLQRVMAE